ncbi:MAG: hypothetical protein UR66_C0004G0121 [Candidatus Moranbacteria bacterium GW2011_GWE1_35_17]|nr:MAG: hypothetical protein UR66_C0004G0121 [Candidatus Moranbacteria bacterium GW2011_GWE1_35_17]KKP84607.1 MAG: hypothetical protein UR83_C0017G0003 [Candidatus Moranbacteria bacterium GW2011_GWF2_35_54]HBX49540.1 hypothetical protein [Bacteroidales bacterium]
MYYLLSFWSFLKEEPAFFGSVVLFPIISLIYHLSSTERRIKASRYLAEIKGRKTIGINGPKIGTVTGIIILIPATTILIFILGYLIDIYLYKK